MGTLIVLSSPSPPPQAQVTSTQVVDAVRAIIMDEGLRLDYAGVGLEERRVTFRGYEVKQRLLEALEDSALAIRTLSDGLPAMMGYERLQFTREDNRTPFAIEIIEPCKFAWLDHSLDVVVYAEGESVCAFLASLRESTVLDMPQP